MVNESMNEEFLNMILNVSQNPEDNKAKAAILNWDSNSSVFSSVKSSKSNKV